MKLLIIPLFLSLALPAWGATFSVTVPATSVDDLQIVCDYLAVIYGAKDPTNSECGSMLIRIGEETIVRKITDRVTQKAARLEVSDRVAEVLNNFPSPLRDAVCGDNEIDTLAGEICDDGGSNSDITPDACRTYCHPAHCGDDVVDTGEVCDGEGCLDDCSGLE